MNIFAMIPWWVWVMLGAVVVLEVLVAAISTPAMKGRIGERRVARRLRDGLGPEYEILNDVYLLCREGETTQIDHVVVSPCLKIDNQVLNLQILIDRTLSAAVYVSRNMV